MTSLSRTTTAASPCQRRPRRHHVPHLFLLLVISMVGTQYTIHSFTPSIIATPSTNTAFRGVLQQRQQQRQLSQQTHRSSSSPLFSTSSSSSKNNADFDYQELTVNLRAMKEQKLTTANQVHESKRRELEGYVRKIVQKRESPVPLWQVAERLPGTKWRLSFSTQAVTNESLPAGVQISLQFVDSKRVDYSMEFTKTLGLSKLTAQSLYTVDSSPVHPGWVTYTYDKITTDVLGFKNVGIGMMGMLQGRGAQIQTVYYDDDMWIETGKDGMNDYFNVYTREDNADDDWQK